MIKGIICIDKNGGIGKGNSLLTHLPKDLQHFKEVTSGKTVVMGNNTLKSLPFENGLPNRRNMVITSEIDPMKKLGYKIIEEDKLSLHNLYHVECCLNWSFAEGDIFIIGGASIYSQLEPFVEEWIITEIDHVFEEADVFFKPNLTNFEDTLQYKDVSSEEYPAIVSVWRKKL